MGEAINKVVYGSNTLIDLTSDTVTASTLKTGITAHDKSGDIITGTMPEQESTAILRENYDANGAIVKDITTLGTIPLAIVDTLDSGGGTIREITADHVLKLQAKTVTTTASTASFTADSGYDGISEIVVHGPNGTLEITENGDNINIAPYASASVNVPTSALVDTKTIITNGTYTAADDELDGYSEVVVNVGGGSAIITSLSVTPSESTQTFNSSDYDGYKPVTVAAVSSDYIGSNVPLRSSTDLTASDNTVSVPSGYYSAAASKSVVTGSAGTPTATKGSVSSNSINITPSVTNTTGYITGSTINGTPVTVTASELVSGTYTIDDDGIYDVTNYASASVAIDYPNKSRNITFVVNRTDASAATVVSFFQCFGLVSNGIDFSTGVGLKSATLLISQGATTANTSIYFPKSRPIIIVSVPASFGNYDITIDSNYGECVDVPHVLGSSNTAITKAIYLKTSAPDTFTVTITLGSQTTYPETVVVEPLSVVTNGTYTPTSGTAYGSVTVAVPSAIPSLQTKTKSYAPTELVQTETVSADSGYDGLSEVGITVDAISSTYIGSGITQRSSTDLTASGATVTVPSGYYGAQASKSITSGSATTPATTITANPTISINSSTGVITAVASGSKSVTPTVSAGYVSSGTAGTISVSGSNTSELSTQAGATIAPTESEQTAVAAGKYTTGAVKVGAISSTYVGSGISQRTSASLTRSGATITAPAGYYAAAASSAVPNGTATAPSTISGTAATVSTGTNTLTLSKTISVTPTVSTAGYISSGTAGNASVSLTATVSTKAAATITPGTSNQTIASGTYLTGIQTISGDSNLVGSNIISGKSIFGVSGSVTFITYYTGTSAPASSLGSNGDIYLKTS